MNRYRKFAISVAILVIASFSVGQSTDPPRDQTTRRSEANRLMGDGNWAEAYKAYAALALDPADDPLQVSSDLTNAVSCLARLGRLDEVDDFREGVIQRHGKNWRLLQTAAQNYLQIDHQGSIIAGEFERGPHRGGTARYVNSYERDRVRALQLMQQALPFVAKEESHSAVASFYLELARMLMGNRGYYEAWRLQYLTDLDELPDYEDGYYYPYYYGGTSRGAPVDEQGNPVFYYRPEDWASATSDGQRWRWALDQAAEYNPALIPTIRFEFASFLHNQFGVQTMEQYRWFFGRTVSSGQNNQDESGTYALHTLAEDETIARLANGVKRFKLPDEFNFIKIFRKLVDNEQQGYQPIETLAQIFENRRQYPKAADLWRLAIKRYGEGRNQYRTRRLEQIVDNWGTFEPVMTQPAGSGATVEYLFRNGTQVSFEAHEIDIARLLADVKAYLKSNPGQLDWDQVNIQDVGHRLVLKNQKQYIGRRVASWNLDLQPRPNHFDKRITVTTPLQKAGAYLLTAKMQNGNVSRIVIWIADTAIVKKQLDNSAYFYVADAVTGKPIPKANVEFFGYWQEGIRDGNRQRRYTVHTRNFAEFTDADGQLFLQPRDLDSKYRWLIMATTPEGRLAYMGFEGVWYGNYYDQQYNQSKVFVITDRPVYRPNQTVKFKFWVNHAKYDQEGDSAFAGKPFTVRITDPKSEKVFEKIFTADQYGGFDGEFELPDEPALGVYSIHLPGDRNSISGGGTFRVEEYKKPEFEVTVEAPSEPVMLGEKIMAKVKAKYYFGAPVTEAKVKYKVLRSAHDGRWYPVCLWDWFYGPGYWWFAYDYEWYPGWYRWGCLAPVPWWWWEWYPREQPEVVADGEAEIGSDGTLEILIDTAVAKAIYSDRDHKYEITAEVTDQSRRTIVGTGQVLVAREPFKVYAWVDRGHYRVGDIIRASFSARTIDGKPVKGTGKLRLLKVTYKDNNPVETEVQSWNLDADDEGRASQQLRASQAGQYRLSYEVTDAKEHTIEGGYVFVVRGEGFDGSEFRFNDLELIPDKRDYAPGETVHLMINTNRAGSAVVLFVRPTNGVYLKPNVLRLDGKSITEHIEVIKKDMPNFYVEAFTISGSKVFEETREIIVPPESRVLNVEVTPSSEKYKPGEPAQVEVKVTDMTGEPYEGSLVVSIYDKSVEYISGGSNVPDIKEFFWKWRRRHHRAGSTSLNMGSNILLRSGEIAMGYLGVFGHLVADQLGQMQDADSITDGELRGGLGGPGGGRRRAMKKSGRQDMSVPTALAPESAVMEAEEGAVLGLAADNLTNTSAAGVSPALIEPTVRTQFADTALWVGELATGKNGKAQVELTMPENLTTWKTKVWAMGDGARVGEGATEVVTTKNLIIRLQAPRFFVQKDEVVLSANVHNYLENDKRVQVVLELDGDTLEPTGSDLKQMVHIDAQGETRVDWRVKVVQPGEAIVRMKALSDEESDAMEMRFPVYIHGMLKTESFCGVVRPQDERGLVAVRVPAERLPEQSRLEVRYSPSLAMAMVDALPYMVDYPYGCTEQTLNRFLPTVLTQKILLDMGLDLKEIQKKRTNLNAQEIGDDVERAKRWAHMRRPIANPVFDEAEVARMVKAGLERLTSMQVSDGGWGWFSGWGERSYPHTTAVVVHGLQLARANDVAIVPGVLERGVDWLKRYQDAQLTLLKNAAAGKKPYKKHADNLDALIYMVLVDEGHNDAQMSEFLYRDRNELAVYAKAMLGLALNKLGQNEQRDMLIRNIEQYLVEDDENHTAYLKLPNGGYWWYWYGSEYEAQAYYLKLLAAVDPTSEKASRLVKYLLNNRRHATYWNSTRDTAIVIEAFVDHIKAVGEDEPNMTLELRLDGKTVKAVEINKNNLFTFDNKLVLEGDDVTTGEHQIELIKKGTGPVYFNAYLTNFTLEDPITSAGLEIKVQRHYYKLIPVDKEIKSRGDRGQAVDRKVEKYKREPLDNLATLSSGDLVEIELVIDSKNDYEYILFEDMKPAGFEPVELRSGYNGNDMGAYMELRDERVTFFVRTLARGKHSVSYRMRAEIPGKFSAMPTKASAMYAPELKANADEIKLRVTD